MKGSKQKIVATRAAGSARSGRTFRRAWQKSTSERITHAHQKHVFVGKDFGKFQANEINHLRAELNGGYWATEGYASRGADGAGPSGRSSKAAGDGRNSLTFAMR